MTKLGWFYSIPDRDFAVETSVRLGIIGFIFRYGRQPNRCLMHRSLQCSKEVIEPVQIVRNKHLAKNMLWFSVEHNG